MYLPKLRKDKIQFIIYMLLRSNLEIGNGFITSSHIFDLYGKGVYETDAKQAHDKKKCKRGNFNN